MRRLLAVLMSAAVLIGIASAPAPAASQPTPGFVVASLNVLGSGHTDPGGARAFMASGVTRTNWMVQLLRANNVDLVGLQEFQPPQVKAFLRLAGKNWGVFPRQKPGVMQHNAVAWKKREFTFVRGRTVGITYMKGRKARMPVVRLREKATGREFFVISVHNAPGKNGYAHHLRTRAMNQEIALTNRLRRTGLPVIMTGDMNDRERFFCQYSKRAKMHAAAGGTLKRGCQPPPGRIARVDWIFGSKQVRFSKYRFLKGPKVRRTTDHPLVKAHVRFRGAA